MTRENADAQTADDKGAKNVKVLPEKQDDAKLDPATAEQVRDEQDRRAIMFAAPFFLMLAAPMFMATEDGRSMWRMTRHEPGARALLSLIFAGPVCLGLLGLWRGLRRRVPERGLAIFGTVISSLYTLAGTAIVIIIFMFERRATESPWIWLSALMTTLCVGSVVRSFFHSGWRRWQLIASPIALLAVMLVLLFAAAEPRAIERADQGGWVFLFAAAGLVPFVGTAWRRKK